MLREIYESAPIYVETIMYKSYRSLKFYDFGFYIIGQGDPVFKTIRFTNTELLISLLNLYDDIIKYPENDISNVINYIIRWCEKYGLPLSDKKFQHLYYENGEDAPIILDDIGMGQLQVDEDKMNKINGFSVSGFINTLSILNSLTIENTKQNIQEINILLSSIKLCLRSEYDKITLCYMAKSPLVACIFMLANSELEYDMPRRCQIPTCNRWFNAKHGNCKYCDECIALEYGRYKIKRWRENKKATDSSDSLN